MAGAAAPFNGNYRLLAESLLTSIGANVAAGPAPPAAAVKYSGDRMDVERTESHMTKWLSENCADTNATVLQNVRLFMDRISNIYKDKIAMYETRSDMERLSPGSVNPNAFSDMVTRLCEEYNDAHPNWRVTGGDVRSARFGYLPEKVAPCRRSARRHYGTKTGPPNGATVHAAGDGGDETCRGICTGGNRSAFWKAHVQFAQLPEFCDFADSEDDETAPVLYSDAEPLDRECIGVYNGFGLPTDILRWSWVTISKPSAVRPDISSRISMHGRTRRSQSTTVQELLSHIGWYLYGGLQAG